MVGLSTGTIHIHHCHLLLLLTPKADIHFTILMLMTHAPETGARKLAPVFHASCKISGARKQHGQIKSNQTFYLAIRPTHVK